MLTLIHSRGLTFIEGRLYMCDSPLHRKILGGGPNPFPTEMTCVLRGVPKGSQAPKTGTRAAEWRVAPANLKSRLGKEGREERRRSAGRQAVVGTTQHAAHVKTTLPLQSMRCLASLSCFVCRTCTYFPDFFARPRSSEAGVAYAIRIS